MDEVKPAARLPTVDHRESCELRGSRTVLGAPGGEIPPGDSSNATIPCDSGKYGSIRRICACESKNKSAVTTPPRVAENQTIT